MKLYPRGDKEALFRVSVSSRMACTYFLPPQGPVQRLHFMWLSLNRHSQAIIHFRPAICGTDPVQCLGALFGPTISHPHPFFPISLFSFPFLRKKRGRGRCTQTLRENERCNGSSIALKRGSAGKGVVCHCAMPHPSSLFVRILNIQ